MEKNVLSKDSEQDEKKNETINQQSQELEKKLNSGFFGKKVTNLVM